jgi:hypothetical protein
MKIKTPVIMKTKLFIFIIALQLSVVCNAQSLSIWSFYHSVSRGNGTSKFTIPGLVFKISALAADDKDARFFLKKLGKIRIITQENSRNLVESKCYTRFVSKLRRDRFEDFIQVRDKDENVNIMVRQKGNKIKGFVMLVKDKTDFTMVSAKCNFSLADFQKLITEHGDELKHSKIKVNLSS